MIKVNQIIKDTFLDVDLEGGLTIADFTITLFKDGEVSNIPVLLTEIATVTGFYSISFTPDEEGIFSIDVVKNSNTRVRHQQTYHVHKDILDESVLDHLSPGTLGDYLNRVKKYTSNRVVLDPETDTYSVKEDDGVTEFESGTSTKTERGPN
jgi:hypothetical protein